MQRNRLAGETSPYLLQHADNPVDWHPWDREALELAQASNKPILLSIGYSACHWCHVMAHESFEDPATATLMNELFVNIKVDREERPDLDRIYQIAQQLLTHGHGGWPLTMFLSPGDQQPFFGGTYFPKQAGHGLPAFTDLLRRVAEYFHGHSGELGVQTAAMQEAFASLQANPASAVTLDAAPLAAARAALEQSFDAEYGGFTRSPKFPNAGSIERCMRQWYATSGEASPDLKALYMATLSLTRMAEGGLYDQLGGGFARYSVDREWMIPHFEKMLYDNATLLAEYARAALATGEPLFFKVARESAEWVLRDLHSPAGGFFSSLDADSAGQEGRFYLWSPAEVQEHLRGEHYLAFAQRFGLDRAANFEGAWHLHCVESIEAVAARLGKDPQRVSETLDVAREALLAVRRRRIWPARDDKVLTSWNALMIKGLALASRVLHRADFAQAAGAAVDFIRHHLWRDGRLLATYKDGRAHLPAYLDDYVFLADALLELLQTRWRSSDLSFAQQLIEVLLEQFEDAEAGGFYFTAREHERLIHRSKSFSDESIPSGNGVAASLLCRMGYLLGNSRYLAAAERTLQAGWAALLAHPQSHMSLLNGLEEQLNPPEILLIRGSPDELSAWSAQIGALYAPRRMLFAIPSDAQDLPPALAEKKPGAGTVAYLCTGTTCSAPMNQLQQVVRELKLRIKSSGA